MKMTNYSCTEFLLKNSWFHFSMNYTRLHNTSTTSLLVDDISRVQARVFNFLRNRLSWKLFFCFFFWLTMLLKSCFFSSIMS